MLAGGCDRSWPTFSASSSHTFGAWVASFDARRTLGAGPRLCPSLVSFDAVGVGDVNGNGSIDYLLPAASLDTVYLVDGRR